MTIGSPADFIQWIDDTFGTDLKDKLDPNNLPEAIANVVKELLNLEIGVDVAKVIVPPKDSSESVKFAIVMSVTFPGDGIPLIPGLLTLKGGVAGATNDPSLLPGQG